MSENIVPGVGQSTNSGPSGSEKVSGHEPDDGVDFAWMQPTGKATTASEPTAATPAPEVSAASVPGNAGRPVTPERHSAGAEPSAAQPDGEGGGAGAAENGSPAGRHWPTATVATETRSAGSSAGKVGPMRAPSKLPDLSSYPSAAAAGEGSPVFNEPLPTSMLQVRPPQDEVDRRAAEREEAAKAKPVLPRVMQVLLAAFYPVVLLVLAIRLITTPLFLWAEYHRPGFPADSYGFGTDDRMTYGSYAVDYLLNFAGPRYLGGLVNADGRALFGPGEVSHMADVKSVITMAFMVGAVLAVGMVIAVVYLMRRSTGGVRRGLFAGSIVTLVLVITLGVLGFMGWETFFTDFHELLFKNGTWTFYLNDTLIRLFPGQFWEDAGLVIGVVVFVVSTLTLAFTWPTKSRRRASARAKNPVRGHRAAAGA